MTARMRGGLGAAAVAIMAVFLSGCLPVPAVEPVDFAGLVPADRPNWALACSPGRCPGAPVDQVIVAGPFAVPPAEVAAALVEVMAAEPRTEALAAQDLAGGERQRHFVQRSRVFGFPDLVTVSFWAGPDGTAIAVYSRAVYGYGDFGVNRRRVERVLAALHRRLDDGAP